MDWAAPRHRSRSVPGSGVQLRRVPGHRARAPANARTLGVGDRGGVARIGDRGSLLRARSYRRGDVRRRPLLSRLQPGHPLPAPRSRQCARRPRRRDHAARRGVDGDVLGRVLGATELPPALRSAWLPVHVTLAFLGNAVFALAFATSLVYLFEDNRFKAKQPRSTPIAAVSRAPRRPQSSSSQLGIPSAHARDRHRRRLGSLRLGTILVLGGSRDLVSVSLGACMRFCCTVEASAGAGGERRH